MWCYDTSGGDEHENTTEGKYTKLKLAMVWWVWVLGVEGKKKRIKADQVTGLGPTNSWKILSDGAK